MWHSIITETRRDVIILDKKIKELADAIRQIDKLLTQILKIVVTATTIWAVIKGTFFLAFRFHKGSDNSP